MKSIAFEDYTAFIGLDWADSKHDVCLQQAASQRQWALGLLKRFDNRPVARCCELKKGPLINALAKYPHIVIFPFNPAAVAKYRKAFAISGASQIQTYSGVAPVLERSGNKS